jgi:hypothetical protein
MQNHLPPVALVSLHLAQDEGQPPLGAACIAATILQKQLLPRDRLTLLDFSTGDSLPQMADRILENNPGIVGFSLYCWNSSPAGELARLLRSRNPGLCLAAGGPDAELLATSGSPAPFDTVFLGEAEESFTTWLERFANDSQNARTEGFIRGRASAAESLASPWLEGVIAPARGGMVAWELTRGCPFRCAYCYEGRGTTGLRHLPEARIDAELELFLKAGIGVVFVLDPTFNIRPERALAFLGKLRRALSRHRGADRIHWHFEVRAELLDRAQAKAFAGMQASLQIGLQSADPAVLAKINRNFERRAFTAKIGLLNAAGAIFGLDLIYGLPGDSLAGFERSLEYSLSLAPNHLDIFPLSVLPGTELHERAQEFGLVFDPMPPYRLLCHGSFSHEDMGAAARYAEACRIFYTEGRAVPWFLAVAKGLGMKSFELLREFGKFMQGREVTGSVPLSHRAIEALQAEFLPGLCRKRGKQRLEAIVLDLVRYHGACSRAFAEGEKTRLKLSYPPWALESPNIASLEAFEKTLAKKPCSMDIGP